MCPGDTDSPPLLQNLHILANESKKDIFMNKGNHSGSYEMIWIILKLGQDILLRVVLCLSFFKFHLKLLELESKQGAQWLSGRVLDSRPRVRGFEPHRRHCVVVLEQDTFILA